MENFKNENNTWLKFGCFLSGYNYNILSECSETSKKYVRKITAALVIIICIWGAIGYMFANRYAGANIMNSIISGLFASILVLQIERQIILGKYSKKVFLFRIMIGLIIAIIGALILDQVFFKNDIEKRKEDQLNIRIEKRISDINKKAQEDKTENQRIIDSLGIKIENNNIIANKNGNRINNREEINLSTNQTPTDNRDNKSNKEPTDKSDNKSKKEPIIINRSTIKTYEIHPKLIENEGLRNNISNYENLNRQIDDSLYNRIEKAKFKARNEAPGFLDELNIIYDLASESKIALFTYIVFFAFFVIIELLIVFAKSNDGENDYNRLILYQEKIREDRLKALEMRRTASIGETERIANSDIFLNKRPK